MRIFIFIFLMAVASLATDFYIHRLIGRCASPNRKRWQNIFFGWSVFLDLFVIVALVSFGYASDLPGTWLFRAIMWVIGIFILHAAPKFVYVIIAGLGRLVCRGNRTRRGWSSAGWILGCITAAILIYGLTFGRSVIRTTEIELEFADLPESFDGLRIVEFADLHLGTMVNRERFLGRIVDTINSLDPDIVVNGGDLINIHYRELDQRTNSQLSQISARYGVYSVMGNHDLGIYIHDTLRYSPHENFHELIRLQRSLGWNVLVNESAYVTNGIDTISISGLNYPAGFRHNGHTSSLEGADIESAYGGIDTGFFNIALTHAPQLWREILEETNASLSLAGHVHSMQLKLRIGKYKWSPAGFVYDRWSGLYEVDGRYLYINDGAGYVMFPMRIGARPEITLITLKKKR